MLTLEGRGEEQAGGEMGGSFRWCQPSLLPPLHMSVYPSTRTHQNVNLFLPLLAPFFKWQKGYVIGMGSDMKPGWRR